MRRRTFIAGLGGATAWPLVARAQQPALPIVGFLRSIKPQDFEGVVAAFRQGLGQAGYIDGQNVSIEYCWADGQDNRLAALAADLVRRQVSVIVANSPAAVAAKAATTTIPIVFDSGTDPVQLGLVTSLSRPGGNITGVSNLNVEVGPKGLELLHELVPAATNFAALVNPTLPGAEIQSRNLQAAARTLGLQLHVLHASTESEIDAAFATLIQLRTGGLVIGGDPFFTTRSEQLAALALRHAVPVICPSREFAAAGGLMSYSGSITDAYRLVGVYTGRILKGEKPANLPVLQATKVEFVINLKTAKALGLTIPAALLARADEVIE